MSHAKVSAMAHHIVCGADFTPGADVAYRRALMVAEATGLPVRLLHAHDSRSSSPDETATSERLNALAAAGEAHGVAVEPQIVSGPAWRVLASAAESASCRLAVLGRRSGSSLEDRLLGGTTERLIRSCSAPILVTRSPPDGPYARALAAIDFEAASREALGAATSLRMAPPEGFAVAHAMQPFLQHILAGQPPQPQEEVVQEAANDAHAAVLATARRAGLQVDRPVVFIEEGDPVPVLLRAARQWRAELIVMGTHGRDPVRRFFLGSTASAVLRSATCDVLVKRGG